MKYLEVVFTESNGKIMIRIDKIESIQKSIDGRARLLIDGKLYTVQQNYSTIYEMFKENDLLVR